MGQAKLRGNAAQRQAQAIEAGRVKEQKTEKEKLPLYVQTGYKPSLVQTLTEVSNHLNVRPYSSQWADSESSPKPVEPFHHLSKGAEATAAELELHPDLRPIR